MSSAEMYCITVRGVVGESLSSFVEGMSVRTKLDEEQHPVTTLTGKMIDQAMLMGVLNHLYDLCLPLIQVQRLDQEAGVRVKKSRNRKSVP